MEIEICKQATDPKIAQLALRHLPLCRFLYLIISFYEWSLDKIEFDEIFGSMKKRCMNKNKYLHI